VIECGKCGNKNPLGRVFCTTCGAKLQLLSVTKEHVEKHVTKWYVPLLRFINRLGAILIVAIIATGGMAFWPSTAQPVNLGTSADAKVVRDALSRARMKAKGIPPKSIILSDKQINAYLQNKLAILGVQSATVVFERDSFTIRLNIPLKQDQQPDNASHKLTPLRLIADITFKAEDNALVISKVVIGHVPLPGPFRPFLLNRLSTALSEDKDWKVVTAGFSKITVTPESISATPKP
jgi:hypothetical protein